MVGEIIARCGHCGYEIGRVSHVPGEQKVGCPSCGKKTLVRIKRKGYVDIKGW